EFFEIPVIGHSIRHRISPKGHALGSTYDCAVETPPHILRRFDEGKVTESVGKDELLDVPLIDARAPHRKGPIACNVIARHVHEVIEHSGSLSVEHQDGVMAFTVALDLVLFDPVGNPPMHIESLCDLVVPEVTQEIVDVPMR